MNKRFKILYKNLTLKEEIQLDLIYFLVMIYKEYKKFIMIIIKYNKNNKL